MVEVLTIVAVAASQFLKAKVWPKWGDLGVQIVVFGVVFFGAAIWMFAQGNEAFLAILMEAGKIFLVAVGFYEVVMKRLGFKTATEMNLTREL